jgi:hypothetical protein
MKRIWIVILIGSIIGIARLIFFKAKYPCNIINLSCNAQSTDSGFQNLLIVHESVSLWNFDDSKEVFNTKDSIIELKDGDNPMILKEGNYRILSLNSLQDEQRVKIDSTLLYTTIHVDDKNLIFDLCKINDWQNLTY